MPSLTNLIETFDNRGGDYDDAAARNYTRIFRAQFDILYADQIDAMFSPGIPRRFDPWVGRSGRIDLGARAKNVHCQQDPADPFWWTITVEYSTRSRDPSKQQGGEGSDNNNPIYDPPHITWGSIHDKIPLDEDFNVPKRNIRTSAGEPFQPRPEVDRHRMSLTYVRNEAKYIAPEWLPYWDCVNSVAWKGWAARTVKLGHVTSVEEYRNYFAFWKVTYYFEFRLPDWDIHLLDQGTKTKAADGRPVQVIARGVPGGIVDLDGDGGLLAPAAGVMPKAKTLTFKAHDSFDLAILQLNGF